MTTTNEIILYRARDGDVWMARHTDPEVQRLFGTDAIPTAFASAAPPEEVLREIRERNPSARVRLLAPGEAGTRPLDARVALACFLDAIDSRKGVGRVDVDLARLAIGAWKRQEASVRLLEKLLTEIQDDGPTDETLYAAKREAES